jgi:Subtilase family
MKGTRVRAASSLLVLVAACAILCAPAARASTVSPLPASDYTVRSACKPPTVGRVGCLALELVPSTAAARAHTHPLAITTSHAIIAGKAVEGAYGLRPQDLSSAYFPGEQPDAPASEPQTIALVDAYNDLDAEVDLKTYDEEFSLPECTSGNGCFEQVNQNGETGNLPFPSSQQARQEAQVVCEGDAAAPACKELEQVGEWSREISLDIEVAHAVCKNCHIALVEADNGENASLETAEDAAAEKIRATEISNSWGGEEPPTDGEAFNHPGTVITVATGDSGYLNWNIGKARAEREGLKIGGVNYPASSPHVVAVGGTRLTLGGPEQTWSNEIVWDDGGDGCSASFPAQAWQLDVADWSSVGCEGRRAVSDVSADADPYSGVAIYDSFPELEMADGGSRVVSTVPGWHTSGGTSLASPIIAAMFALAGGSHSVAYPAQTLYSHIGSASLHDVVEGGSGECEDFYASGCSGSMDPLSLTDCGRGALICNAAAGYDGPSGVGTPDGIEAFRPARVHTGGGPQAPITEACGGPIGAGGAQRVCGKLNPDTDAKAGYYFAYNKGTNCTGGKETEPASEVEGQAIAASGELTGLEPATEYTYCLIATDVAGETSGPALTFTTEPKAPRTPQTRRAIDVTDDAATLEGKLGPQPIPTSWYFEYAPGFGCTGPGAKTTQEAQDTMLGEPGDEVSTPVELNPGTEYTACLVAKNRIGSTTGTEVWFTTESIAPAIDQVSAESTSTEATIEATVSPNAQTATCEILYGTSESYGSNVACKEGLGTYGNHILASAHIASLKSNTTYYFQIVADNKAGASSPSEGKGSVKTQPPSTPREPVREEATFTPTTDNPILSTVTPVIIPPTPTSTASKTLAFSGLLLPAVQRGDSLLVELTVELAGSGVDVDVTALAPQAFSAKKRNKAKPVMLARLVRANVAFGRLKLTVPLNAKGKRALKCYKHLTLRVKITVTPPTGQSQTATHTITLKRR